MNNIVPINQVQAPSSSLQAFDQQSPLLTKGFTDGVLDSFPSISIRGKVFRKRYQGQEEPVLMPGTQYASPYLDVVLVAGSQTLSKVYYEKGFAEGDMAPPDCFSLNSVRPDPSSPKRQNVTCAGCPMNKFGSRITPAGKMAKACQDSRRIVVALPEQGLGKTDVMPIMLRVPQSSTKPLREYVEYLKRHRFLPNACVTRLEFDKSEAFPKLTFQFVQPLTDDEYKHADFLGTDERTQRILEATMAIEDADPSEMGGVQVPSTIPSQPVATAPAMPTWQPPVSAPAPVYQPAPAPAPVPEVQPAPVNQGFTPPAPPVVAAPPAPAPAPAPVETDEMAEFRKWKEAQAQPVAPAAPVAPPAPPPAEVAPPPVVAAPAPAPTMQAAPGGWQAPASGGMPGPGWGAPPAADTFTEADVPGFLKKGNGGAAEPAPAAPEPVPAPKKRKPPAEAGPAQGAQQAPAALDDILSKLKPKATQ